MTPAGRRIKGNRVEREQTTPARELFRVATEQGWDAFQEACRKTLADEWRLGFDAGARIARLKP